MGATASSSRRFCRKESLRSPGRRPMRGVDRVEAVGCEVELLQGGRDLHPIRSCTLAARQVEAALLLRLRLHLHSTSIASPTSPPAAVSCGSPVAMGFDFQKLLNKPRSFARREASASRVMAGGWAELGSIAAHIGTSPGPYGFNRLKKIRPIRTQ
ncbi:hypothetical protein GUJ93_ZPchr0002g24028 [Zizania palustris]|uniref:Uncharacterized protein n=1 Tax=Zizania palustris TaxID=103762 RepID=A0A8J5SIB0_ZIZPA|nr:hypothetical protein GUJ93_ZPchr0002g24028 [Zizania palustris]